MAWPQRCKVCHRRDKFDFTVTEEVWRAVVPEPYRNRVVCLACFDSFASQKGVDYAHALSADLYFAGDAASFVFNVRTCRHAPGCK